MQQPPPNQRALSMADRSARSVFIGNISYDVTEAQLRQLFSRAGQVVHLRVVHDRETGRPKGYGFCEFTDQQIAETAQRTLNGYEMNGRQLRVDSATGGERSADEVQQFQMGLSSGGPGTASQAGGGPAAAADDHQSSPYGPEPEAGKAPEAIARTVASLPPERMFELMRQMKETVLNNSMLARTLLMENPQLAYALLQAQVVMRIVDPKVAYSMLHREQPLPAPFHQQVPPGSAGPPPTAGGAVSQANVPPTGFPPSSMPPSGGPPQQFHRQMPPSSAYSNFGGMMPPQQGGMPSRMPPPMQHPAAAPAAANSNTSNNSGADSAADEEQQAQMLVKVLQLTEEQIQLLPPDDRVKVIELRKQLRQQLPSA